MSDGEFRLVVPPGLEGGVYANLLSPWRTAHELTLDFAVARRLFPEGIDEIPAGQVVARVRIPVTMAFEMIRRIHDELTAYEREFGEVRRPGDSPETR
jgi:Protein of unknown function (DUF3467).